MRSAQKGAKMRCQAVQERDAADLTAVYIEDAMIIITGRVK
jgi:hypothetical protein